MENIYLKYFLSFFIIPVLLVLFTAAAPVDIADKPIIHLGIIPLTDCAPIVMAKELGLFAKYGVNVEVSKEALRANVRDKILTGKLDGAHCLFSMPFSVYTGVGGKATSYATAMLRRRPVIICGRLNGNNTLVRYFHFENSNALATFL